MPRVRPLTEDARSKFIGAVTEGKIREGIRTNAELADRIGMTAATFSRHMRNPDMFSRGQIRKMISVLKIPKEDWGRLL